MSEQSTTQWTEHNAPDGRRYWFNKSLQQSLWEKPEELLSVIERTMVATGWREYGGPEGRAYWYNSITKISSWFPPITQTTADESASVNASDTASVSSKTDPRLLAMVPEFETKEQAENAFIEFLEASGVQADWTWEQTMRVLIQFPMYRALKTTTERREAFEKFIRDKRYREVQNARETNARNREDFLSQLAECKELTQYSRFSKAQRILGENKVWQSIPSENERRQLFDSYMNEMRRKIKDSERKDRDECLVKIERILGDLPLTADSLWTQAQDRFYRHPEYTNDNRMKTAIDELDIFRRFQSRISSLERQFSAQRKVEKDSKLRQERKNRDAFKALLIQLKDTGKLNVNSKWKEIFPWLKDEPAFLNMLGQPGSTPMELYRDLVADLELEIYRQGKKVQEILKSCGFVVTLDTQFEEFNKALTGDKKFSGSEIMTEYLPIIFDVLLDKAKDRAKEEKRKLEKKMRRIAEDFRYLLKKLDPAVTVSSKWEDVRPLISHRTAFKDMESDEFRIAQFEKYLRRLEEKESKRKSQPVDSENYNSEEDDTGSQHRHASSSGRGSDKNRNDRVEEELRSKRHRSHREESVHSDQDRGRSRRHKTADYYRDDYREPPATKDWRSEHRPPPYMPLREPPAPADPRASIRQSVDYDNLIVPRGQGGGSSEDEEMVV